MYLCGQEDAQDIVILEVARQPCRRTDLPLARVIDNRQTALSGNREVSLSVQDLSCMITSGSKEKVESDGIQQSHLSGKVKRILWGPCSNSQNFVRNLLHSRRELQLLPAARNASSMTNFGYTSHLLMA